MATAEILARTSIFKNTVTNVYDCGGESNYYILS